MSMIVAAHVLMGGGFIGAGCMLIRSAKRTRGSINCFRVSSRLENTAARLAGWACLLMGAIIIVAPILAL